MRQPALPQHRRDCSHGLGGCSACPPERERRQTPSFCSYQPGCCKAARRGARCGSSPVFSCSCRAGDAASPSWQPNSAAGTTSIWFFAAPGSVTLGYLVPVWRQKFLSEMMKSGKGLDKISFPISMPHWGREDFASSKYKNKLLCTEIPESECSAVSCRRSTLMDK